MILLVVLDPIVLMEYDGTIGSMGNMSRALGNGMIVNSNKKAHSPPYV